MSNVFIDIIGLGLLLLIYINGHKDDFIIDQKIFMFFLGVIAFDLIIDAASWIMQEFFPANMKLLVPITIAVELKFFAGTFVAYAWLIYLRRIIQGVSYIRKWPSNILRLLPLVLAFVICISNYWTEWLFTFKNGYYERNIFLFPYFLMFIPYQVYCFVIVIKKMKEVRKSPEYNKMIAQLVALLLPFVASIIQGIFYNITAVSFSFAYSMLIIYLMYQKKHVSNIKSEMSRELEAITFGNFDLLYKGEEIKFKRTKSKELLAYLIDKRGTSVNTSELIGILYEDSKDTESAGSMVRNLVYDINNTFKNLGIEGFFIKSYNSYRINSEILYCDYYDYLKNGEKARKVYSGEYMNQYSWAELTAGYLERENLQKN